MGGWARTWRIVSPMTGPLPLSYIWTVVDHRFEGDPDALLREFGAQEGGELGRSVETLLAELAAIEPEWGSAGGDTLAHAAKAARAVIAASHLSFSEHASGHNGTGSDKRSRSAQDARRSCQSAYPARIRYSQVARSNNRPHRALGANGDSTDGIGRCAADALQREPHGAVGPVRHAERRTAANWETPEHIASR